MGQFLVAVVGQFLLAVDTSSPYAASKAAGDHFARAYFVTYGLPVVVTHSCNNIGPRQAPEKLVPLFVRNAIAGLPMPLYGEGRQVRDWLSVDDHVRALWRALVAGRAGETYDFGGVEELENREAEAVLFAFSSRLRVSEEVLDGELPGALYVYKGTMSARAIAERLERLTSVTGRA